MLKVFYIVFIFFINFSLNSGIDTYDLRHNKGLEYFFDIEEGVLKRINEEGVCTPIALSEVPYWSPALDPYHLPLIFVQQQKANNLAEGEVITRQVIKSLAQKQGLWFYIKLTSQSGLKRRIVCWFPDWPGLGKIPHDGSTQSNQGVMLLNIQPKYIQDEPFEILEGSFANGAETWAVYGYEYIVPLRKETAILSDENLAENNRKSCVYQHKDKRMVQGNTFIAVPCFANYDLGILTLCGIFAKAIVSVDLIDVFIKSSAIGASFNGIGGNFGNQMFDNIKAIDIFNVNFIGKAVDI